MTKMNLKNYDVAVIGCGIAGSMAAIAAARHGSSVIAIDEAGYPGGALTAMGTGPMMTFHAGETQVVRGLPQEMVTRLMARGFSPGHTVDSTGYTYTVTPFSSEGSPAGRILPFRQISLLMLPATEICLHSPGFLSQKAEVPMEKVSL